MPKLKRSRRGRAYRYDWPADVKEQIELYRKHGQTWAFIAREFGISLPYMYQKAKELQLSTVSTKHPTRRFTPEEDEIVKTDWVAGVDIHVTAAKLGRSWGVVRQRLNYAHPELRKLYQRYPRVTALYNTLGVTDRKTGLDGVADKVRLQKTIEVAKAEARARAVKAKDEHYALKIKLMMDAIANGKDRNEAIFECRACGISLEAIGQAFGITRERVRQVANMAAYRAAMQRELSKPDETQ